VHELLLSYSKLGRLRGSPRVAGFFWGKRMAKQDRAVEAANSINRILAQLDEPSRQRVFASVVAFFNLGSGKTLPAQHHSEPTAAPSVPWKPHFSDERKLSPKEFLFEKQPKTDVERMACLAYYLTHFRDMPHFRTLDLAKLNTEAAQTKFSNAAYAASNATLSGYLAAATKGQRQISAAGEQFVVALPDREAAKQAMGLARRRKNARRKK